MLAMLETHDVLAMVAGRSRRGGCPPHGPHLVNAVEEGLYEAQCLRCGLVGPERKDSVEAKLALDQKWHQVSPS
jgi:hypothetical protein